MPRAHRHPRGVAQDVPVVVPEVVAVVAALVPLKTNCRGFCATANNVSLICAEVKTQNGEAGVPAEHFNGLAVYNVSLI